MDDGDHPSPFANIEAYWGEELSEDLAERIVDAPEGHLDEFRFFLEEKAIPYGTPLPNLEGCRLRPIVTPSAGDLVADGRMEMPFARAVSLLLFSHEVVTDDVSIYLSSRKREERAYTARELLAIKPLFDANLIHFRALWQRKMHPSMSGLTRQEADRLMRNQDIVNVLDGHRYVRASTDRDGARYAVLRWLATDVNSNLVFADRWPGAITQLLTPAADRVARHRLRDTRKEDPVRVLELVNTMIPTLNLDLRSVVSIRQNDKEFERFRQAITTGLRSIEIDDVEDSRQIQIARANIRDSLEPMKQRLERSVRSSSVLAASLQNMRNLAVSGATAAPGLAFADTSSKAMLAGGGTALGLATGLGYDLVTAYRKRKSMEPLADLIAVFDR